MRIGGALREGEDIKEDVEAVGPGRPGGRLMVAILVSRGSLRVLRSKAGSRQHGIAWVDRRKRPGTAQGLEWDESSL